MTEAPRVLHFSAFILYRGSLRPVEGSNGEDGMIKNKTQTVQL